MTLIFNLPLAVAALYIICITLGKNGAQAFSSTTTIDRLWKSREEIRCDTKLFEAPVAASSIGPRQVDMNQYNIDLDIIQDQWVANLVAKSIDSDGGIFLGCENTKELFVDTVTVSLPRKVDNASLGIGLQELAGGRGDGVGITIVSEIIDGGLVQEAGVDILPGDSICDISVLRNSQLIGGSGLLSSSQETIAANLECLDYDNTVEAIVGLPPAQSDEEQYLIKLKRIRRKPVVTVNLRFPPEEQREDETLRLFAGENLRQGMLVRGIQLNDASAKRFDTKESDGNGCGAGGLCRTCSVGIIRGAELLNPQKPAEKQMLQGNTRWRLGCKTFVGYGMKEGELTVQVHPRQW